VARVCTICTDAHRDSMDSSMLSGERLTSIAKRFGVSQDALSRHKKHQRAAMALAAARTSPSQALYGSTLLGEVFRIRADAERLQRESEGRRDLRGALRAIHERLAVVELEARLSGQIESQRNVTIKVQAISPEEAVEYARDVLELFAPPVTPALPLPVIDVELSNTPDGGRNDK
jgi:hypothetical protein